MSRRRKSILLALIGLAAGWMVVDGTRALLLGDYFTVAGELGPWSALVESVGIPARSTGMKAFFVVYGGAWLVVAALFAGGKVGRRALIGFAMGSVWYLVPGTILSLIQLGLLARPEVPPAETDGEESPRALR